MHVICMNTKKSTFKLTQQLLLRLQASTKIGCFGLSAEVLLNSMDNNFGATVVAKMNPFQKSKYYFAVHERTEAISMIS